MFQRKSVGVYFEDIGLKSKSGKYYLHGYSKAILTPTAREVRQWTFRPDIPYAKKIALDSLMYFGSVKVFLKFSKPFWAEKNKILPIFYNSTKNKNGGTGISDDLLRIVGYTEEHNIQSYFLQAM